MSTVSIHVETPPERVFEVLSDPRSYPDWVVGAKALRGADPSFPAVGSRFHHCVGAGPLAVADHTEVLDADPPWRLELEAKARPFGSARVVLMLQGADDDGTTVTMIEEGYDLRGRLALNPVAAILLGKPRNQETLRRLKRLAEAGGR